jgi:hypothetical protein
MPKILINEENLTSPGSTGMYSNYSVLIPGFMPRKDAVLTADADSFNETNAADIAAGKTEAKVADEVQPDANGVYEFSSADKFRKTIGLCSPKTVYTYPNNTYDDITVYHYGNQMAYELLKLGYTVIYLPIESVADLKNEDTWSIFKDKASYDFRFVTHGMLNTSDAGTAGTRIAALEKALKKLLECFDAGTKIDQLANKELEIKDANTTAYINLIDSLQHPATDADESIDDYSALLYKGDPYVTLSCALYGCVESDHTDSGAVGIIEELAELKAGPYSKCVTKDIFDAVNSNIAMLAKYTDAEREAALPGRGDCVALIELDENAYLNTNSTSKPEALIIDAINEMPVDVSANGAYCALTVPSVVYKNLTTTKAYSESAANNEGDTIDNQKMPGTFHYLACFKKSLDLGFAEWYAAAGYTRGVSSYVVDHTTVKLGEIAINALEPRYLVTDGPAFACNVIANFRGSYYLWGNRTAYELGTKGNPKNGDLTAQSFLNIRQLSSTIKKQLYVACRRFTFDPNSDTLWFNFVNAIRPTLELMKADQGIRDYRILKITEANPAKATLKAKVRIIPIEAVEDFDLTISLEDSFGETTATVTE